MDLDDIDWAVLDELQADGRIGFRELGRRVGLSAPAVAARVHKLEDAGIISGYRAVVDELALGLDVRAFVRMNVVGHMEKHDTFLEVAKGIPEIVELNRVSGEQTYVLRVVVSSVGDLERVLHPLWEYGDTVTGVIMSAPIAGRPIVRSMVPGSSSPRKRS
ncbi:MAG TPA: Lrp/AsnC family transcriptional regulator [Acidimicrobiia bacterium]|nr:Lrp/AsnC family transcriptional regulator [Acidimicrobiia bacterium]